MPRLHWQSHPRAQSVRPSMAQVAGAPLTLYSSTCSKKMTGLSERMALLRSALALATVDTATSCTPRDGLEVALQPLAVLGAQLAAHAARPTDHDRHLRTGLACSGSGSCT